MRGWGLIVLVGPCMAPQVVAGEEGLYIWLTWLMGGNSILVIERRDLCNWLMDGGGCGNNYFKLFSVRHCNILQTQL